MKTNDIAWHHPVFFRRNRVFRVYKGGKLFYDLLGDDPVDGNTPEEWICSSVHAINSGHDDPLEGLSLRLEDGTPFNKLLEEHKHEYLGERNDLGVLVKYLDSAIRLPMQVHPSREFSKKHFGSPYGKAEAWLVLETRPNACIYFGFSREVSKSEFEQAVERSEHNKNTMTEFVNRVPVKRGDVFFVDAGTIHAIGAGCLILEVQEPTDFTIQPEYYCGDYRLSAQDMYIGLSPSIALDCFDYHKFGDKVVESGRKTPQIIQQSDTYLCEELIGAKDTPCFKMNRHTLQQGKFVLNIPASIWICTEGEGIVISENKKTLIKKGGYFFLPAAAINKCFIHTSKTIQLVSCIGGI